VFFVVIDSYELFYNTCMPANVVCFEEYKTLGVCEIHFYVPYTATCMMHIFLTVIVYKYFLLKLSVKLND